MVAADSSVSTTVNDTIDVVTVDLSATAAVLEDVDSVGGTENVITYTASLTGGVAANNITVTLDNGESITIIAGQTSGSTTTAVVDEDVYIDGTPVVNAIASAIETNAGTAGALESLVVAADSSVSTTVNDTIDITVVTLMATESVEVGGNITYTATVLNPPVLTPLILTIIDENSVELGTVTIAVGETTSSELIVAAPNVADASYDVTMTSNGGGAYEDLNMDDGASTIVNEVPASSALLVTNTNNEVQLVEVVISSDEGANTTGVVEQTEVEGQEGSTLEFLDDVVFVAGESYTVTVEHNDGPAIILTDLAVTDSLGNLLEIYEGNAKLETGEGVRNTNPDGYIFNVAIGDNFVTDATDYTVSEAIGYEVLGGVLTLDTETQTADFILDFSELSINGGQDLFGDVETINISGKGLGEDNTIYISAQDILDLGTAGDSSITITGDVEDVVNLVDLDNGLGAGTWTQVGATETYTYTGGAVDATAIIDSALTVNLNTTALDGV